MAILGRVFIAVPDDKKDQVLFKWPDINLRKGSRLIVEPDMLALFVNKGEVVGTLGPGQHRVEADEIMGLGAVIDWATDGNAYRAELFFVGTREYTSERFGGRIDDVQDPQTGNIVTLGVFGEYSFRVTDPAKLVLNLVGTIDVPDNDHITDWVEQQMVKVMRTEVTRQIVGHNWPVLGLSAYTPEIEQAVIAATNEQIADYGLAVARMGNFDLNLSAEDQATLKKLAKDTAYSRLAGGFQQYAQGEALLGAGEGMAKGGGAGTGAAFLGVGMGMANQMNQPGQGPMPPAAPGFAGGGEGFAAQGAGAGGAASAAGPACTGCGAATPPGAKFCAQCGTPVAQARFCAECGNELVAGAKFCAHCGTAVAEPGGDSPAEASAGAEPTTDTTAPEGDGSETDDTDGEG
ncbi:SPFH domain-containing protein [Rhabdothermincola salaria]|uniref:SPFH domain-containing protein n=1 Tax=Rhabdothermincola salaria TaxID=2903142 RepID=UPI003211BCE1